MIKCTCHLGAPLYCCDLHRPLEESRLEAEERAAQVLARGLTDEMIERHARSLFEQGFGFDIDADATARASMLAVSRRALTAALETGA